jgi:hypothetical protein
MRNVIDEFPQKRDELLSFLERPGVMIENLIPPPAEDDTIKRLRDLGY